MASFTVIATFLLFAVFTQNASAKMCAGCIFDDHPTPAVKKELNQVVQMQNADVEIIKIISLKKQIVAGIKYYVEFAAKSKSTNEKKVCKTVYVVTPWKGKHFNVISFSCGN